MLDILHMIFFLDELIYLKLTRLFLLVVNSYHIPACNNAQKIINENSFSLALIWCRYS